MTGVRRQSAGRRFGILSFIALLFIASGGVRSMMDILPSVAFAAAGDIGADTAEDAAPAATTHDSMPAELAAALATREARVLARETALADRAAAIALAEDVLRGRLEALEAAEQEMRRTLAMADAGAEADVARLITVYETMKPKDASGLFDAMDAGFAAGFLGRMRPDAVAAVMAGMSPDKAYAVSAILAGRNAAAPKN